MNQEGFTELLQQNQWSDEWWVALDGAVLDGRMPLKDAVGLKRQMPSRQISLLHPKAAETTGIDWKMLDLTTSERTVRPQPKLAEKKQPPPGAKKTTAAGDNAQLEKQLREQYHQLIEVKNEVTEMHMHIQATFRELREGMAEMRDAFDKMANLRRLEHQLEERRKTLEQSEQMLIRKALKQGGEEASRAESAPAAAAKSAPAVTKAPEPERSAPKVARKAEPEKQEPVAPADKKVEEAGASKLSETEKARIAALEALLPGRPVGPRSAEAGSSASKPPPPSRSKRP